MMMMMNDEDPYNDDMVMSKRARLGLGDLLYHLQPTTQET